MSAPKFSALLEKLKASAPEESTPGLETGDASTPDTPLDALEFEALPASPSTPPPLPEIVAAQSAISALRSDARFWSELSTRLWRAERQLKQLHENSDSPHSERLMRRFEEIMETLREHDIEILDHTGEKYDAGLTLKVLQYEPQDGIAHEVILETVKPSVRLQKVLVPGEVIVATPLQNNAANPEHEQRAENETPQEERDESQHD